MVNPHLKEETMAPNSQQQLNSSLARNLCCWERWQGWKSAVSATSHEQHWTSG